MAAVAPPTDREAAHHLGLQDTLPGRALSPGRGQSPVCGRRPGECLKAAQTVYKALGFLFLFELFYFSSYGKYMFISRYLEYVKT